jgi:hypothetical protein
VASLARRLLYKKAALTGEQDEVTRIQTRQ